MSYDRAETAAMSGDGVPIPIAVNTNDEDFVKKPPKFASDSDGDDGEDEEKNVNHLVTMHRFEGIKSWWFAVDSTITAIQIASLVFIPVLWPDQLYSDFLRWITVTWLNWSGNTFSILYYIFVGGFVAFILLSIVGMMVGCGECLPGFMEELMWYYFGDFCLFGIFFVPLFQLTIEGYHCVDNAQGVAVLFRNSDIQCWHGIHILYIVLSSVSLVLMVLASLVKIRFRNDSCHDPQDPSKYKVTVNYFESWMQIQRAVLIISSVFLGSSTTTKSLAGLSFWVLFLSVVLWGFALFMVPHVFPAFNVLKTGALTFISWIHLCAFLNAASDSTKIGSYLLILTILVVPLFMFVSDRISKSRPPEFAEVQMQAMYADPKGRNIERKFEDDPFVKNWCSRHNIDVDKCAHFFYQGPASVRSFLDIIGMRSDLQAVFVKGSKTNMRTESDVVSLDDLESLRTVVALNKGLKAFSINGHKLTGKHLEIITSFLKLNLAISLLDLFDNNISTLDAEKMIRELQAQTSIEELNLGENNIDADGRAKLKSEQEVHFPGLKLFL